MALANAAISGPRVCISGLVLSLAAAPRLSIGLDQAVALPGDSYLQSYFRDLASSIRVGPPLFFVVEDLNVSVSSPDVNSVCAIAGCAPNSLLSQVASAARTPSTSYIAAPAASWLDDFMAWLNPGLTKCCRRHTGAPPSPSPSPAPSPSPKPSPSPSPSPAPSPSPKPSPAPSPSPSPAPFPSPSPSPAPSPSPSPTPFPLPPPSPFLPSPTLFPSPLGRAHSSSPAQSERSSSGRLSEGHGAALAKHRGALEGSGRILEKGEVGEEGGYCPPPDQPPCSTSPSACTDCEVCVDKPFPGVYPLFFH
ncbi:hypothetical protein DUNSADRAFT_11285 [Dunaliella salina]|uniref:Encoded protein n=1 Tax=Dunaliella salina TaxID=3046 RepID=A0ABQ7GDQ3_DUNSA|nr:hypothetical protein DUNSADRAFT_11285 [Dunaliella salina]|eukprot:KAF5832735.1 hypothetical protein DUNSADRAFT_11285 [Dunaliella salina]